VFTGLVETIKPVKSITKSSSGLVVTLSLGHLGADARPGDSICINGVCLTISSLESDRASFDVMAETVRVSTLGDWKTGDPVNLERALAADGRFGGHIVQGHVDGVGKVEKIERSGTEHKLWIGAAAELMDLMISKGSVAIDGVSLTIVDVQPERFSVSLIPTTLKETNLDKLRAGNKVNLEADLLSKWIKKRLDQIFTDKSKDKGAASRLTMDKLREQGFI
jgi:riboflavin synthase